MSLCRVAVSCRGAVTGAGAAVQCSGMAAAAYRASRAFVSITHVLVCVRRSGPVCVSVCVRAELITNRDNLFVVPCRGPVPWLRLPCDPCPCDSCVMAASIRAERAREACIALQPGYGVYLII